MAKSLNCVVLVSTLLLLSLSLSEQAPVETSSSEETASGSYEGKVQLMGKVKTDAVTMSEEERQRYGSDKITIQPFRISIDLVKFKEDIDKFFLGKIGQDIQKLFKIFAPHFAEDNKKDQPKKHGENSKGHYSSKDDQTSEDGQADG